MRRNPGEHCGERHPSLSIFRTGGCGKSAMLKRGLFYCCAHSKLPVLLICSPFVPMTAKPLRRPRRSTGDAASISSAMLHLGWRRLGAAPHAFSSSTGIDRLMPVLASGRFSKRGSAVRCSWLFDVLSQNRTHAIDSPGSCDLVNTRTGLG